MAACCAGCENVVCRCRRNVRVGVWSGGWSGQVRSVVSVQRRFKLHRTFLRSSSPLSPFVAYCLRYCHLHPPTTTTNIKCTSCTARRSLLSHRFCYHSLHCAALSPRSTSTSHSSHLAHSAQRVCCTAPHTVHALLTLHHHVNYHHCHVDLLPGHRSQPSRRHLSSDTAFPTHCADCSHHPLQLTH